MPPHDTFAARDEFPDTPWTHVALARDNNTAARSALAELCELYWLPVYGFFRRCGRGAHDAEDLTQDFFRHILNRNDFARIVPERGRLRSYLLSSARHFMTDDFRKKSAAKRGGENPVVSLDVELAEQRISLEAAGKSPEAEFDRNWATMILENSLLELQREYAKRGSPAVFGSLVPWLTPAGEETGNYTELSKETGLTESNLRVTVHRLRKRYRELVCASIAPTVESEADVAAELDYFLTCLS